MIAFFMSKLQTLWRQVYINLYNCCIAGTDSKFCLPKFCENGFNDQERMDPKKRNMNYINVAAVFANCSNYVVLGGVSRKRQKQSPCDFGSSSFLYIYTKNSQSQHDCFSMICVRNCGSSFAYFIWPNSTMTHWVW